MLSSSPPVSGTLHLDDGRKIPVVDGLVIGRSADCGVPLDDEKSSRHHARIVVQVGVVEVEDLGSRNGTLLNGSRVQRRMLRDGDVLTVGHSTLTFRNAETVAPRSNLTGPAPGEDLFGDEESEPAAPAIAPKSPAPPRVREPISTPAVDVLEFADDDVVEVRKPTPVAAPSGVASARPAPAQAGANRVGGVLQFSARPDKRGALAGDLSQVGGLTKFAIVLLAIALAVGLGWLVMNFVAG